MRHIVAIVLIVCGSALALAPAASESVQREQVAKLAAQQYDHGPIHFVRQPLEESYRVAAWMLGVAMIGLGILGAWRHTNGKQSSEVAHERSLVRAAS